MPHGHSSFTVAQRATGLNPTVARASSILHAPRGCRLLQLFSVLFGAFFEVYDSNVTRAARPSCSQRARAPLRRSRAGAACATAVGKLPRPGPRRLCKCLRRAYSPRANECNRLLNHVLLQLVCVIIMPTLPVDCGFPQFLLGFSGRKLLYCNWECEFVK